MQSTSSFLSGGNSALYDAAYCADLSNFETETIADSWWYTAEGNIATMNLDSTTAYIGNNSLRVDVTKDQNWVRIWQSRC